MELMDFDGLFDEKLALYMEEKKDKYTEKEAHEMGINDSIIHEDFMIGTKDLSIIAVCADGRETPIFKDGEWAI